MAKIKKTPLRKKSPLNKSSTAVNPVNVVLDEERLRSGVDTLHGFYPRVWVSLGQKIQVRDYEPIDIQLGYSIDVKPGDKPGELVDNMILFVKTKIKPLIQEAMDAKKRRLKTK